MHSVQGAVRVPVFMMRPPIKNCFAPPSWQHDVKTWYETRWRVLPGRTRPDHKLGLPEWHLVLEEYMGYVLLRRQLNNNTGLRAKPGG